MSGVIERERSVIVATDVKAEKLEELVKKTCLVEGIGGYKFGLRLALQMGLPNVVKRLSENTDLPLIFDLQKAGNDIPHPTAEDFAEVCAESGIKVVILFPLAGPETQVAWTKACQDEGLTVITGGEMTHPKFLRKDGGYIVNEAPEEIYKRAIELGVRDFVVPGNKPESVVKYRTLFERELGVDNFTLYAPGFISQGGDITETGKVAGRYWHAIVGSGIYKQEDMHAAAERVTAQVR